MGEEGSWQQEVRRRKAKKSEGGGKKKKKPIQLGTGVSSPVPGSPQPGAGGEKTVGGEEEEVRWRED